MKKKRYLMIACLLFSPSFFINVEASERGSSSVGIEFYKKVSPKEEPSPKTDQPGASPKGKGPGQTSTNQGMACGQGAITTGNKQLPRTGSKRQANLSILGFIVLGLVAMVHRKKGRHEAK
ncbi:LPXTG cell wall anchor domain-containing protein [Enterococcus faecalis]|nr:LPXTG cell wall anchor domain-containing protein [Enterococcus faecalis]